MAEALLGLVGAGSGVGDVLGDLERAIARVTSRIIGTLGRGFDTLSKAFGKFVDWFSRNAVTLAHLFLHYFRIIASYVKLLFRYVARVMINYYREFQRDPLTSLQFVGTIMILVNGGL